MKPRAVGRERWVPHRSSSQSMLAV